MPMPRVAVLDDSQNVARRSADWSRLEGRAAVDFFADPLGSLDRLAEVLAPYEILVPMRERTVFSAAVIDRLPGLRLIALTGHRAPTLDLAACTRRGVIVANTGNRDSKAATSELAWSLIMACSRQVPKADATLRAGGWHSGVPLGTILHGKRLGLLGLGNLGREVARYGHAFGMEVVAWSQNLTAEKAAEAGARLITKSELFATADVVSLHLVLSERTRGIVGAGELQQMKDGAILVNTSRGPLISEAALLAELARGRLKVGLDVYDIEPLPEGHPLRSAPNVVLTPHLGYAAEPVFRQWYGESVENILAYLDGKPIRVLNPEALKLRS